MANSTIIYVCTQDGLAIFNKPGTLTEWLPPRRVLDGRVVLSAWADPGPPIRVWAAVGGHGEEASGPGSGAPAERMLKPGLPASAGPLPEAQRRRSDARENQLLLSENGGRDWASKLDAPVTAVLGMADDPNRLYVGMQNGGLAGSVDGGETWGVFPGLERAGAVRLLVANRSEPGRFYALLDLGDG